MRQGYREKCQRKCQETGTKESGNGIRNGGHADTRGMEGQTGDSNRERKREENMWKEEIKDKRLMRCYKSFLIG